MEKRLLAYLKLWAEKDLSALTEEEKETEAAALLQQIAFFQHERLIHLIVTVTFAILTLLAIVLSVLMQEAMAFLLPVAFLVLLIPYIRHYYLLENGVQKLYTYYDKLIGREFV